LKLLRDSRHASADRDRAWRAAKKRADAAVFKRIAREYEERAERDHEALERVVFYAQTGLCRWRVLLDYFEEPLPFVDERCGVCDNCLRLKASQAVQAETPASAAPAQIRWRPHDEVRVPRYGTGRVEQANLDEVEVRFADGSSRRFVASYVQPVTRQLQPAIEAAAIPPGNVRAAAAAAVTAGPAADGKDGAGTAGSRAA
jgi:ATP-dependent DNA helicase RecQ